MKPYEDTAAGPRLRIDLRAIFFWTAYAVIGITIETDSLTSRHSGSSWTDIVRMTASQSFDVLLGAASAAIVAGLLKQAWTIRKQASTWNDDLSALHQAARWESGFRTALASTLVACMSVRMLVVRQLFEIPYDHTINLAISSDRPMRYLWWMAILISLSEARLRVTGNDLVPRQYFGRGIVIALGFALMIYLVIHTYYSIYLTHLAVRGVDASHPVQFHRYPVPTIHDRWLLSAIPTAAVAAIVGAAILGFRSLAKCGPGGMLRARTQAPISLLTISCCSYAVWFYTVGRGHYSPDLDDAGLSVNWWQLSGCLLLAISFLTFAVYRGWHLSAQPAMVSAAIDLPSVGENLPVLITIMAATAFYLLQLTGAAFDGSYFNYFDSTLEGLAYLLTDPALLFISAMLLTSFQFIRLRWKGRTPGPLVIVPLKPREFIASWLVLAAILAVAILTLAAFSFSFWLGP